MTTSTHPLFSNHTHTYTLQQPGGTYDSVYTGTLATCESGHARCKVTSPTMVSVVAYTSSTADVGTIEWLTQDECDTVNTQEGTTYSYVNGAHLHAIQIIDINGVITPDVNLLRKQSTGTFCTSDGGGFYPYTSSNAWQNTTPATVTITYANVLTQVSRKATWWYIKDATDKHTHGYTRLEDTNHVTALATCSVGHANCKATYTNNLSIVTLSYTNGAATSYYPNSTITTEAADQVDYDSGRLNGSTTGDAFTNVFFQWGTTSGSLIYHTAWQAGAASFNQVISALSPNTTYYFRAVGYIGGVYLYGDELSFTTSTVTPRTSSYQMIVQTYKRGPLSPISLPVFLAECKAWTYEGGLIETQWSNNGYATFTSIPNDLPVYVTARWGTTNYIRRDNIYCSSYPAIANFVSNTHLQNTDESCYGMRAQDDAPSSPANGAVYLDTNA